MRVCDCYDNAAEIYIPNIQGGEQMLRSYNEFIFITL